jgi:hypothetical protein
MLVQLIIVLRSESALLRSTASRVLANRISYRGWEYGGIERNRGSIDHGGEQVVCLLTSTSQSGQAGQGQLAKPAAGQPI